MFFILWLVYSDNVEPAQKSMSHFFPVRLKSGKILRHLLGVPTLNAKKSSKKEQERERDANAWGPSRVTLNRSDEWGCHFVSWVQKFASFGYFYN